MSVSEDTVALGVILKRATSLLDSLNDAIDRAVRKENQQFYRGNNRTSPVTPLDQQASNTASSDSPNDYNYMVSGESYVMPKFRGTAADSQQKDQFVPGEAKLLSEIRESLCTIEETLYKVLELSDDKVEERSASLLDVERCRESLLSLLRAHKGLEKAVVQEVLVFCNGELPSESGDEFVEEKPLEEDEDAEAKEYEGDELEAGYTEEADEDIDEIEEEDDDDEEDVDSRYYYSPMVYRRSLVSPFTTSYVTPLQQNFNNRRASSQSQPDFENDAVLSETEFSEDLIAERADAVRPKRLLKPVRLADPGETSKKAGRGIGQMNGAAGGRGEENDERGAQRGEAGSDRGGSRGILGAILRFPGSALCALGDAVGNVANFSVKLAVVGLGAAAVISLTQELALMYRNNRKWLARESLKRSRGEPFSVLGDKFECTIRERVEMKKTNEESKKDPEVFLAVG